MTLSLFSLASSHLHSAGPYQRFTLYDNNLIEPVTPDYTYLLESFVKVISLVSGVDFYFCLAINSSAQRKGKWSVRSI